MKQRMNITLLGHKDHGKSTLIGRLLYDTGSVKEDRVAEVRVTSEALDKPFEYAFLLDSFEEEREGGLTIDVIHAQIKGQRYLYDCIDVPGHKELIKNMLSGASHADAGILIVSAKEGIEEQTGQHLRLADWLGLERLIVAINKMDLFDYDQAKFEEMKRDLSTLIRSGLNEGTSYIPVSAYTGENVVKRSTEMTWYTGPTLFERMEGLEVLDGLSREPLRLPVQDFYPRPHGPRIIVGRVESGWVRAGQTVQFVPSGATTTVKEIVGVNGNATAKAGQNAGLLCEPDPLPVKRGEVCCPVDDAIALKRQISAHAIFLGAVPDRVTAECGTAQTACTIQYLAPVKEGEVVPVVLELEEPLPVERSKTAIGRLALKHEGRIIGVAVVG